MEVSKNELYKRRFILENISVGDPVTNSMSNENPNRIRIFFNNIVGHFEQLVKPALHVVKQIGKEIF